MSKTRKIAVVITARPSYSRVKTLLQGIKDNPKLELQLIVVASALLERYGAAVEIMRKDGFDVSATVFNVLEGANLTAAAKTTGLGIMELSTIFENHKPDIVVTVADRFETISTAIAAAYMNIPLAHIQGGEVTGNIDEKVRHAITKIADYHFVASDGARQRVLNMGEEPEFVFNYGCPSIDLAAEAENTPSLDFDPYEKYGGVGFKPDFKDGYIVVMQHPVSSEHLQAKAQIQETLHAVKDSDLPCFWFWPNVDTGADETSAGIRYFRENYPLEHIHFFKNMEPHDFLKLLMNSRMLIGNSSVGIRECSYLRVPVINIGSRQSGRDRGKNVIDIEPHRDQIRQAIETWLNQPRPDQSKVYGGGDAGKRIASKLAEIPLRFIKKITY